MFFTPRPAAVSLLCVSLCSTLAAAEETRPAEVKAAERGNSTGVNPAALDDVIASLDKDKDGKITKAEASGSSRASRFAQWDANGDGVATRQEIHDFRIKLGIDDSGARIPKRAPRPVAEAVILKEPASWRLETMAVPPSFAPDVPLKGTEEVRFAPGMFDTKSSSYFTYLFAITVDDNAPVTSVLIQDFLLKYFRGLCGSVGRDRKFNLEEINGLVGPMPASEEGDKRFLSALTFLDCFTDGRKIALNIEIQVVPQPDAKKNCLIFLVSPSDSRSAEWKTLHELGTKAAALARTAGKPTKVPGGK